jgi:pimeloyl-ACP methyl ester carboxylesterase
MEELARRADRHHEVLTPPEEAQVTASTDPPSPTTASGVTVVLVHGAFADGSSWNGVIDLLQRRGHTVVAPANPLRGLGADSAYLAGVLGQIDGPVLLVGHSYGGAVIANAATDAANVVGLVHVCAFVPDEGELLGDVASSSKDSLLGTAQVARQYPTGPAGQSATEFLIDAPKFYDVFAADLSPDQAAVLAATQRPVAQAAFTDASGPPAWKRLPSWAVVATADRAAGTDIVRSMAQRAGAEIVELEGSHLIMVSRPEAVTDVIVTALGAVATGAADLPEPRRSQEETAGSAGSRTP